MHKDLVERDSLLVLVVHAVELAVGSSGAFHRLAVVALLSHLVCGHEHLIGAPTVKVAACGGERREQRLDDSQVGVSRDLRNIMALQYLGDKLAVGTVGVGDKPVIHFAHTKHLIHNGLWIAFA